MHIGCSWQEKIDSSSLVRKWGIMISDNEESYTVVNLTDNGKISKINYSVDAGLRAELVATVRSNVSSAMQSVLDDLTNYSSHKPTA